MVRERGARGVAWTVLIVLAVGAALTLPGSGSAENRQIRPRPPRPPARRDAQRPKPPRPKPPVKDIQKSKRPLPGKTPAASTVKGRIPKLPFKDAKKKGHTHKKTAVPKGKKVGHTKGHGASSKARPHLQFSLLSDTRANLFWNTSKDVERYALFRGGPRRHDATPLQVFDNSRHVHPKLHRYIGNLKPGVPSSFVLVAYRDRSDKTGTPSNVVIVRTGAVSPNGPNAATVAKQFLNRDISELMRSGDLPMALGVDPKHCCANFVSGCLERAGIIDHGQRSNSVQQLKVNLENAGWQQTDFANAKPGDVVFFQGSNVSHTEVVESNDRGRITLIGSNNVNPDGTQRVTEDTAWAATHARIAKLLTPPRR